MPREVAKVDKEKGTETWSEAEVVLSLEAILGHRFAVAFRLGVLYGLRRSEALALRWDDLGCALQLVIEKAGVPRLSSHGLRHTAATHMVKASRDVGELRTVADVLAIPPTC
jgi:integrase